MYDYIGVAVLITCLTAWGYVNYLKECKLRQIAQAQDFSTTVDDILARTDLSVMRAKFPCLDPAQCSDNYACNFNSISEYRDWLEFQLMHGATVNQDGRLVS